MKTRQTQLDRARDTFRSRGGLLRTAEAIRLGVHPRTLYAMKRTGVVERLSRGLYRLQELPPLGNPDLVSVAMKVPGGVICLLSALAFHELTTQIPHEVYVALERGAEPPRLDYPPIRIFWYSGAAYAEGIAVYRIDGVPTRIYTPEKTIADCFKYRNKIGLEVALEGLREWRRRRAGNVDDLWRLAKVCRVANVMRPYLEALQ